MVSSRRCAGRELLEGEGGVRVGAEAAGDEHPEAGLDGAVLVLVGDRDDADVVEHGLAAVGGAAGEVDLELPGQALHQRVAQEVLVGGLGPGGDVEHLVGAGAGEVAALDVAVGVAAGLAARHADDGEVAHDVGDLLQLDEVELDVLAGRDVAPAPAVGVGDVGHHVQLRRGHLPVGDLDPDHLVGAALALAVDAVGQAEHPEGVLGQRRRRGRRPAASRTWRCRPPARGRARSRGSASEGIPSVSGKPDHSGQVLHVGSVSNPTEQINIPGGPEESPEMCRVPDPTRGAARRPGRPGRGTGGR